MLNSSAHHIPLLVKGDLEVSLTVPGPGLFQAVGRGGRIRLVCGREEIGDDCHDTGVIFARKDRFPQPLVEVKHWKGKKFGISQKAGLNEYLLDSMLEWGGLASDEVERLYLARTEAFAALEKGSLDAVVGASGDTVRFRGMGPNFIRDAVAHRMAPHFQYSQLIFAGKLLDELDSGSGFVAAYMRGVKDCLEGFVPKFLKDYATSNKMDPATLAPNCLIASTPDGSVHVEDVAKLIAWSRKRGYIESAVEASQVVDTRFLDAARKRGGKGRT